MVRDLKICCDLIYPNLPSLSYADDLFVDKFSAELSYGLAASKAVASVEDLPFNLTADELLTKAQAELDALDLKVEQRSKWWRGLPG